MQKTNLTKFYRQTQSPRTVCRLEDFYENQIVECALFKGLMRVLDIDIDLDRIYIYNVDELSGIYILNPQQLSIPAVDEEIVQLLYL